MKPLPQLGPDAREVVLAMVGHHAEQIPYVRDLASNVGLPVEHVRAVLRQLGEMHLAAHGPLFNQDTGAPAGSSWWLTQRGLELQASLNSIPASQYPAQAEPVEAGLAQAKPQTEQAQ